MNTYTVMKNANDAFDTYFNAAEGGGRFLGVRSKYKQAQRLCEQTAGRPLDWKSLGSGNYEGK